MILARPANHYSPMSFGMKKVFGSPLFSGLTALVLAFLFLIAGTGEFAVAQDIVGRISGTVTDAQGAAVPGATVTIINEATAIARSLKTDGSGYFVVDA